MQKTRTEKPQKDAENDRYARMHENFNFSGNMMLTIMFPDNTRKITTANISLTASILLCLLRFTHF